MHRLFVVSHTHWDREWYEPFQIFRMRLVRCIDKLLDILHKEPEFRHFMLDGQAIVLEDYSEVRPDRRDILRDLVRADRIDVGPWYVLPDEFLVSGESIIRNFLRGIRIADESGGTMRIAYIPDPFGHISQMPQILRGFGFSSAVFRRGLADESTEVWWESSDGTRVLASYLREGYGNAALLPEDATLFVQALAQQRDLLAPYATTENILLMNGTDHTEPSPELPRLLQTARERMEDTEIVHASLPMYVDRVMQTIADRHLELPVVRGELRNPKRHHLLPGVASARMWIKQRNAHAQTLLEKWVEPFAAFASLEAEAPPSAIGSAPEGTPSDLQRQTAQASESDLGPLSRLAWKYLLQNHPHDSICGCGVDQTHADMIPRFEWAEQIGGQLIEEQLGTIGTLIGSTEAQSIGLTVFNPIHVARTDHVTATVQLPGSLEDFSVVDDTGQTVPIFIRDDGVEEYFSGEIPGTLLASLVSQAENVNLLGMKIREGVVRKEGNLTHIDVTLSEQGEPDPSFLREGAAQLQTLVAGGENATFVVRAHSPRKSTIEFTARDIPGFGFRTFHIVPSAPFSLAPQEQKGNTIENEFLRVEAQPSDGTITITDKATGAIYRDSHRVVDGGDRGDLYNYCPPENDTQITAPTSSPLIQAESSAVRQSLRIRMAYALPASPAEDRSARSDDAVSEEIETLVSVYPAVRRIDFRTSVMNRARDHRLRVEFPTPLVTDHASVEQAFDVVERKLTLPENTGEWVEQPRPEGPMQTFVSVSDASRGLTLATRGLPEYEVRPDANRATICLTLLRCVGWLSRNDLSTRSGDAGPQLETPGAQEIGRHVFEYALIPHAGDWQNSLAEAHAFAAPMRSTTITKHPGVLPERMSFVEVSPCEFVVSAIKLPEEGTGLIVRGYNVSTQPLAARIRLWREFGRADRADLNEQVLAPIPLKNGREVEISLRPKEIVTVRFGN